MSKDALNSSKRQLYARYARRSDERIIQENKRVPHQRHQTTVELSDHRHLWRRYRGKILTAEQLEELATEAENSGAPDLTARCLEDLAIRRARGDWLADNRMPLPGGAYSNLRKA